MAAFCATTGWRIGSGRHLWAENRLWDQAQGWRPVCGWWGTGARAYAAGAGGDSGRVRICIGLRRRLLGFLRWVWRPVRRRVMGRTRGRLARPARIAARRRPPTQPARARVMGPPRPRPDRTARRQPGGTPPRAAEPRTRPRRRARVRRAEAGPLEPRRAPRAAAPRARRLARRLALLPVPRRARPRPVQPPAAFRIPSVSWTPTANCRTTAAGACPGRRARLPCVGSRTAL
jgi:hypothetical protein